MIIVLLDFVNGAILINWTTATILQSTFPDGGGEHILEEAL